MRYMLSLPRTQAPCWCGDKQGELQSSASAAAATTAFGKSYEGTEVVLRASAGDENADAPDGSRR